MRKPDFITFTGYDDRTDIDRMVALSEKYPVEWAVLFSATKQANRYPSPEAVERLRTASKPHGLRLAAHLCGNYAASVQDGYDSPIDLTGFGRVQINAAGYSTPDLERFQVHLVSREETTWTDRPVIGQWRDINSFMRLDESKISWLFDQSGGKGEIPNKYPLHPGYLVWYAGGISPDNVLDVLENIDASGGTAGPYWLDMETGVRTDDWFDLDKVQAVLEAVYR